MGTQSTAAGWIDENHRVFRPAAAVRPKRRALTDSLGKTRRLILPGATKRNDGAANPVALLSSCRSPPLTHNVYANVSVGNNRLPAPVTAPANGHRGRPVGILRGRPARSLPGWVRFVLSQEEAKTLGQSALPACSCCPDRSTSS